MDSGFGSSGNFDFTVKKKKHFTAALKDNRLVALTEENKKQGRFIRIDSLGLSDKQAVRGCLNTKHNIGHFGIRAKLFLKATRQAYSELQILRAA